MRRIVTLIVFLVLVFASNALSAESRVKTISTSTKVSPANPYIGNQWEYLVISFGKVIFSDPLGEPELKALGLSKLVAYSNLGIVSANEALGTQSKMDMLGKFGWELVGAVGAIGGDQELIFKRAYNPDQSNLEAAIIKEEGERLLEAQKNAAAQLAAAQKVELVDLDTVENAEATEKNRREQEDRLKAAIAKSTIYPIEEVKVVSTANSATDTRVSAEITVNGSATLLNDGNKYRKSEAEAIAKRVSADIAYKSDINVDLRYQSRQTSYILGDVKLNVSVIVVYQGKTVIVATDKVGGNF